MPSCLSGSEALQRAVPRRAELLLVTPDLPISRRLDESRDHFFQVIGWGTPFASVRLKSGVVALAHSGTGSNEAFHPPQCRIYIGSASIKLLNVLWYLWLLLLALLLQRSQPQQRVSDPCRRLPERQVVSHRGWRRRHHWLLLN